MFNEKDIYEYELPVLGDKRLADPLVLRRMILQGTSGRAWEWAKAAKAYEKQLAEVGDQQGEEADAKRAEFSTRQAELEEWLAGAAMQAFGLEPVDPATGFGVTETAALRTLYDFFAWLEKKDVRSGV